MGSLEARHVQLAYDGTAVVHDLSLELPREQITAVVGANASGKSTLLRALARLLRPTSGAILLDGTQIHRLPTREVARKVGILPQSPVAPDGLTVEDLVMRGRYPHQSWLRQWSETDAAAVEAALQATGTLELAGRTVDSLSGGQRQRAWIAMALAQQSDVLLLDEPTTHLDLAHQSEVLDLLDELNAAGRTIVLVLHDLNQACRYAHHLVALRDGAIAAAGPPAEVVTAAMVREVFGLECVLIADPVCGTPLCVPATHRPRASGAMRVAAPTAGDSSTTPS